MCLTREDFDQYLPHPWFVLPGTISKTGDSFSISSKKILQNVDKAHSAWGKEIPWEGDGTWEVTKPPNQLTKAAAAAVLQR